MVEELRGRGQAVEIIFSFILYMKEYKIHDYYIITGYPYGLDIIIFKKGSPLIQHKLYTYVIKIHKLLPEHFSSPSSHLYRLDTTKIQYTSNLTYGNTSVMALANNGPLVRSGSGESREPQHLSAGKGAETWLSLQGDRESLRGDRESLRGDRYTEKKKHAQLPAVDMQKVPQSFCCYSNHYPKRIQPSFDEQSLCRLHSDCAKTSTNANSERACGFNICPHDIMNDLEYVLTDCRYYCNINPAEISSLIILCTYIIYRFYVLICCTVHSNNYFNNACGTLSSEKQIKYNYTLQAFGYCGVSLRLTHLFHHLLISLSWLHPTEVNERVFCIYRNYFWKALAFKSSLRINECDHSGYCGALDLAIGNTTCPLWQQVEYECRVCHLLKRPRSKGHNPRGDLIKGSYALRGTDEQDARHGSQAKTQQDEDLLRSSFNIDQLGFQLYFSAAKPRLSHLDWGKVQKTFCFFCSNIMQYSNVESAVIIMAGGKKNNQSLDSGIVTSNKMRYEITYAILGENKKEHCTNRFQTEAYLSAIQVSVLITWLPPLSKSFTLASLTLSLIFSYLIPKLLNSIVCLHVFFFCRLLLSQILLAASLSYSSIYFFSSTVLGIILCLCFSLLIPPAILLLIEYIVQCCSPLEVRQHVSRKVCRSTSLKYFIIVHQDLLSFVWPDALLLELSVLPSFLKWIQQLSFCRMPKSKGNGEGIGD
ncbi:hypothetical protein VP01_126g2 [Puccinia sorghi]|uniref:Uncharacterized protein n=1 Tax=Puccinia sorghi TaxID=27349 RepID=A0A0L6VNZ5_9BASI|nr:hypothetical protein VP01_126g2 [Puccinia sorghi]